MACFQPTKAHAGVGFHQNDAFACIANGSRGAFVVVTRRLRAALIVLLSLSSVTACNDDAIPNPVPRDSGSEAAKRGDGGAEAGGHSSGADSGQADAAPSDAPDEAAAPEAGPDSTVDATADEHAQSPAPRLTSPTQKDLP